MSFAFEPDVHENGQLQYLFNSARRGNAVICRLRASTLKIDYLERSSIEWGIVDKIYDRLEGLCEMRIEIEGVKKKQSDDVWAYARKVERSLTSLRARRDISLIFVANGETIVWETLEGESESNHDEYWSEEGDLDWVLLRTRWLRSQWVIITLRSC